MESGGGEASHFHPELRKGGERFREPWRGAWQNYQETIRGRRPMHPDRLRSIYAIRVTKSWNTCRRQKRIRKRARP